MPLCELTDRDEVEIVKFYFQYGHFTNKILRLQQSQLFFLNKCAPIENLTHPCTAVTEFHLMCFISKLGSATARTYT